MIQLTIDDTCIKCGRCVAVCPARILTQKGKKGKIGVVNLQTCIKCGQCVSICPTDSVLHSVFPAETVHAVNKKIIPSPAAMLEIMRKRRSNRASSDKPVPMKFLEKILEAANLAPTSGNGQALKYTLITNPEVLEAIHKASIAVCRGVVEQMKKGEDEQSKMYVKYLSMLVSKYDEGYEGVLRYAKAVIMIHSDNPMAGSDANLAYQNASLMAEALEVAHFYTGYVCNFAAFDTEGTIKKTMGIKGTILAGMALSMPKYKFSKYVDRGEQIVDRLL